TSPFEGDRVGANPAPATILFQIVDFRFQILTLGSEIGSRLAYNQKSRGQNLPERPFLPRGVIRSASVSETEGPGAKPGEAAIFIWIGALVFRVVPFAVWLGL